MNEILKSKLQTLTPSSGCYLMKNKEGEIIYVGKAKNLQNRVNSYFNRPHNLKTQKLVSEIVDFDIIITDSEKEALLLENNLIKLHFPRYNILLKDDKHYPYIAITNEKNPIIKIVRSIKGKYLKLYGPYSNSSAAYEITRLLNRLFPFRKCKTIKKSFCLYYHIGQCLGPCELEINLDQYKLHIEKITKFIGGDTKEIERNLKERMVAAAEELNFELAQEYKTTLESIKSVIDRQKVDLLSKDDIDFIAVHEKDENLSIMILIYRQGILVAKSGDVVNLYTDIETTLNNYLLQFYTNNLAPKEIAISGIDINLIGEIFNSKIITPQKGVKAELLAMAGENAINTMHDYLIYQVGNSQQNRIDVLEQLANLLQIEVPNRIDVFDNSHFNADACIGAMVVLIGGEFSKREYRKFKITSQEKRDDLASMVEVITRRYTRALEEGTTLPNLILVDGGKLQLEYTINTLSNLGLNIPVAALYKDGRHRTAGLLSDKEEIKIEKSSQLFHFLTRVQDEVHRYAITSMRKSKAKSLTSSILDNIKGLGKKRKEKLLKAYGSVNAIKMASVTELSQYVGNEVAQNIIDYLNQHNNLE